MQYTKSTCTSAGSHYGVLNLESRGCDFCGEHSCPSFYYISPEGNDSLKFEVCPKYDITKDAAVFCQTCHRDDCRKSWADTNCFTCGVYKTANTCHYCS